MIPQMSVFGAGEMAARTRAFDWSSTSAGPIEQWTETLLTTVNTLLASRHPMFLWWGEDLVQFYNDAYRPSLGVGKHPAALGQRGAECWPEIWPIIGPQIEAVMQRGEATWNENQLVPIHRNGRLEEVYWTYGYSPVRDAEGTIRGTLVVCTETTASIISKRQLELERERLADLFHQAPAFFAVMGGADHVFEMVNERYQELIGGREVLGRPVREAIPEAENQGFIGRLDQVYRTAEPWVGRGVPIELARAENQPLETRYLDFVYQCRRDSDGSISGVIVLGVDVTESRMAEKVLMQSEKLNAVGRLASSIAHEINNPLAAVTNLIYLAQLSAVAPQAKEYLAQAEVELRRVTAIATQTLRFYRESAGQREVPAGELLDGTLALYQGKLTNSHVVVERRDRGLNSVRCFEGEIRQVISNLVANAIDAMSPVGGRLVVRSQPRTDWSSGRCGVVLAVADTGWGVPEHARQRIFEPFFTTKGASGTGLGLWISKEIVERHHGSLRLRSRQTGPGAGTVFELFLPCDGESGARD